MATQDGLLAIAIAVTALLNWWSVWKGEYTVERITKPTMMMLLAGLAWSLGTQDKPAAAADWVPVIVALGLSLIGDVLLLTATQVRFVLGLVAFLLAHLAWIWAVLTASSPMGFPWLVLLALPYVLLLHGRFGRDVIRFSGSLRGAVFVYELVLVALLLVAAVKGDPVVTVGAAIFLLADLILGHDRFVLERRWAPVQVMVTYHLAQVLLTVGLLR